MSISTLKVSELKDLLKEHNCAIPAGSNKQKLIELAEEVMSDQVLENQLEFEEFFEKGETPIKINEEVDHPSITSDEWHDYAMSHFHDNELIDGNPICAGLRRVAEILLGEIVETGPVQVFPATDSDGPGRATVIYRVVFNWFNSGIHKTFSEVADVWHGYTDDLF